MVTHLDCHTLIDFVVSLNVIFHILSPVYASSLIMVLFLVISAVLSIVAAVVKRTADLSRLNDGLMRIYGFVQSKLAILPFPYTLATSLAFTELDDLSHTWAPQLLESLSAYSSSASLAERTNTLSVELTSI